MGNAIFYYYPQPDGNKLVTIDLGDPLGQLFSDIEWNADTGVTLSGKMRRVNGMTRERVTIQRDRLSGGETIAHQLIAMQNHLDRGFSVFFSADSDKTFYAPVKNSLVGGDTNIELYPNPFYDFVGTATPDANDYVVLETMGPGMYQEIKKVSNSSGLSAITGGSMTTNDVSFTYGDRLSFLRWYRCWGGLKRPSDQIGQSIITNENGILWSLNVELVVDASLMFRYHPDQGSEFRTEFNGVAAEPTPPEVTMEDPRQRFTLEEQFQPYEYISPYGPGYNRG
tara:strand:- start:8739 stop:9584 length:846 start_codon:yes stop_codon:yes gene_type:complete